MNAGSAHLAASSLGGLVTVNAWRPLRRGAVSTLSWASGLVTSELPLQTMAWQAAATGYFASRGALRTRRGRAGLALSAASWAGLVALHREAQRSQAVLEQALVDELGSDYRRQLAPQWAPPEVPLTRRQLALPARGSRRRYARDRDLAYGELGVRNHLDIWRRPDLPADAPAPVLLQIHGGAWATGSKRGQAYPLLSHLAERGWVGVAINYRLSPRSTWPDHIVDVKTSIAWIKANIARYGGDPNFIAVTGGSAGGHLTALTALSAGDPAFQPGFEDADTTVQAAIPMYGLYDFTNRDGTGRTDTIDFLADKVLKSRLDDDRERWDQASPMSRVRADAPPMFVVHGTNDSLLPVEQARTFAELLRKESTRPVVYAELPRAQHAFDAFGSLRTLYTVRAVDRFLASVLSTPA